MGIPLPWRPQGSREPQGTTTESNVGARLTVTPKGAEQGEDKILPVDTIIVCAGQEPLRELQAGVEAAGIPVHLIGGADVAAELDAKRAINQGSRLAAEI